MQRLRRRHVRHHVAVEDPVPDALRHPGHVEDVTGVDVLGHHSPPAGLVEALVALAVSHAVHGEVEPVQVHGVIRERGVDHAPAHRLARRVGEVLAERPRLAVDDGDLPGLRSLVRQPHAEHERAIGLRSAGPVDHEGAGERRLLAHAVGDLLAGRRRPVEIRAGLPRRELHGARLAGSERDDVGVAARALVQPVNGRRNR